MRFKRWPRPTPFEDTSRKRAAYRRKQVREQAALPLFAEAIAERQLDVDVEMVRRTGQWERQQQESRRQRADGWRRTRARLFAHPTAQRLAIRALWRVCPYPADPSYLGTLLHEIATGRIDPARPPWGGRHTFTPRTTPNPASFAEAFRQIGQRTVGGGPKTTGADERLFCGNLGSGTLTIAPSRTCTSPRSRSPTNGSMLTTKPPERTTSGGPPAAPVAWAEPARPGSVAAARKAPADRRTSRRRAVMRGLRIGGGIWKGCGRRRGRRRSGTKRPCPARGGAAGRSFGGRAPARRLSSVRRPREGADLRRAVGQGIPPRSR
ncbi:hypothetical protein MKK50_22290 [Methylobacterium sp. J-043]|uniref:hypothetical protein n=1 Tax=Methylorubrum TaxID=2282523 RepID=UPI0020A1AB63|nr:MULTISPECIES: hypothetical protein [Methylorubrum]MCJ2032101.1 hypothetical protein [Methylobacterium sp. J-043]MCP1551553.1 hypothetical protein [Methylorubrum zatmanii]MCP1556490.1 hypothetical protein [Methylorubrum extorquens]MCP1581849.1 hypothetical protein [Methylorubrum extorquens]